MVYQRIKDLREDNDLTQTEIAKYLNISQRTYSYYETGGRRNSYFSFIQLAEYYHTSIDYLVNRIDKKMTYNMRL